MKFYVTFQNYCSLDKPTSLSEYHHHAHSGMAIIRKHQPVECPGLCELFSCMDNCYIAWLIRVVQTRTNKKLFYSRFFPECVIFFWMSDRKEFFYLSLCSVTPVGLHAEYWWKQNGFSIQHSEHYRKIYTLIPHCPVENFSSPSCDESRQMYQATTFIYCS